MQDSIGALSDGLAAVKLSFDGMREKCNMSQAVSIKHHSIFEFEVLEDLPLMVDAEDSRIAGLVANLQRFRGVEGFQKHDETQCRVKVIDPFFCEVAKVLDCGIVPPNDSNRNLTVRVRNFEFKGQTDLCVGQGDSIPLLAIEIKPMQGDLHLKGKGFIGERFKHKTQIALQCAAFQAQCCDSAIPYSCLLTDLHSLYVVQIKSYDVNKIAARVFEVVQKEDEFVRAVLRAADDNKGLTKVLDKLTAEPLTCEAAIGFDCNRQDPQVSGVPIFPRHSGVPENPPFSREVGNYVGMSAEKDGWSFEPLLPTQQQQKSDIRPLYTRVWMRLSAREHLRDIGSASNIGSTQS